MEFKDWEDPNPDLVIDEHDGIYVVRDDLLYGGSKMRYMDFLIQKIKQKEIAYGGSSAFGNSQVALSLLAKRHNKRLTIFMAKRNPENFTKNQKLAIKEGANMEMVKMGFLTVTLKRAKDFVAEDPENRFYLDWDFGEDDSINESMKKIVKQIKVKPTEIWSVAGSGLINRALQYAFPDIPVNMVQVGHKLSEKDVGRAKIYVSPYKFDKEVKEDERPPFPSSLNYDAKAWVFIKKYAKKGALFWNVGI